LIIHLLFEKNMQVLEQKKKQRMQKQMQLQLACKIGIIHPKLRKFNFNLDYSLGGKTI